MNLVLILVTLTSSPFLAACFSLYAASDTGIVTPPLEIRSPQVNEREPPPTCIHRPYQFKGRPDLGDAHAFILEFPGPLWQAICYQDDLMRSVLSSIHQECLGRGKRFEVSPGVDKRNGPCRVTFAFIEMGPGQANPPYPDFDYSCILEAQPRICGEQDLPWPKSCDRRPRGS